MGASLSLANVASPSFVTGPNDAVALVDSYGSSANQVLNNLAGKYSTFDTTVLDTAQSKTDTLAALEAIFSTPSAGYTNDSTSMSARVSAVLGTNRGSLTNLTSSVLASLVAGGGLNASTASAMTLTVGSITSQVNAADPTSLNNFTTLVNDLVGKNSGSVASVVDQGAQQSLLTGVLSTCIAMGVSVLMPGILASAGSSDALTGAMRSVVPQAIAAGDTTAINAIVATSNGPGIIQSTVPNACGALLTSFSIPTGTPSSSYPTYADSLLDTLTSIDAGWNKTSQNGITITNLEPYLDASSDALKVLASTEDHLRPATIASQRSKVSRSALVTGQTLYTNVFYLPDASDAAYGPGTSRIASA